MPDSPRRRVHPIWKPPLLLAWAVACGGPADKVDPAAPSNGDSDVVDSEVADTDSVEVPPDTDPPEPAGCPPGPVIAPFSAAVQTFPIHPGALANFVDDRDGDGVREVLVRGEFAKVYPWSELIKDGDPLLTLQIPGERVVAYFPLSRFDLDSDGIRELWGSLGTDAEGSHFAVWGGTQVGMAAPAWNILSPEPSDPILAAAEVDGRPGVDLVVGRSFQLTPGGYDTSGAVLIYSGPMSPGDITLGAPAATLSSTLPDARLGLDYVEDVNGDGQADIVASAPFWDGAGAVFIFLGPFTGDRTTDDADFMLLADPADTRQRPNLFASGLADADGDGVLDLLVSSVNNSVDADGQGSVWLFRGPLSGVATTTDADLRVDGDHPGASADGIFVDDLDGDGGADIQIMSHDWSPSPDVQLSADDTGAPDPRVMNGVGAAAFFLGTAQGRVHTSDGWLLVHPDEPAAFISFRSAGDLNNDGAMDLVTEFRRGARVVMGMLTPCPP